MLPLAPVATVLVAELANGTLVFGLARADLERLVEGRPILVGRRWRRVRLPEAMPRVAILFGETETEIRSYLVGKAGSLRS